VLAVTPAPARGGEPGERRLSGAVATYSTSTTLDAQTVLPHLFVLADVALTWSIDHYWELGLAVRGGGAVAAGDRPEGIAHALLDCRYVIDAMTWSPWLTIGVGALLRTRGTLAYRGDEAAVPDVDLTLHAGLGLDYRPSREWSVGLVVRYNLAVTDDLAGMVGPIEAALQASTYF
jgi:hypothetical protein